MASQAPSKPSVKLMTAWSDEPAPLRSMKSPCARKFGAGGDGVSPARQLKIR